MKKILKAPFAVLLALLARGVLRKYRPKIVMVTGSVGKTSTKDAVAAVLSSKFYLRKSEKSYNSEFGVPLTIFGVPNPWLNPFGWLRVFKEALALIILPNHYPKLLVLEVGADRPGDLKKIMRIATPDMVVLTKLPEVPVHVEAYATPEAVREEEFSPVYYLPAGAPLIYLADDEHATRMAARVSAQHITYGTTRSATYHIGDISFYQEEGEVRGMRAEVTVGEEKGEVIVKGSVGRTQTFPVAAALAAAGAFGIGLTEATTALATFDPPAGRGRLFTGKTGSVIIDDTYNSSPAAVEEALATLKAFPHAKRTIAVLGDMLELGRYSVAEHERIGTRAGKSADIVVSVGIRARRVAEAARTAGLDAEQVFSYDNAHSALQALVPLAQEGDVFLVKGSQSMRMERVVAGLLAHPKDTARLVRQEPQWKRKS